MKKHRVRGSWSNALALSRARSGPLGPCLPASLLPWSPASFLILFLSLPVSLCPVPRPCAQT